MHPQVCTNAHCLLLKLSEENRHFFPKKLCLPVCGIVKAVATSALLEETIPWPFILPSAFLHLPFIILHLLYLPRFFLQEERFGSWHPPCVIGLCGCKPWSVTSVRNPLQA